MQLVERCSGLFVLAIARPHTQGRRSRPLRRSAARQRRTSSSVKETRAAVVDPARASSARSVGFDASGTADSFDSSSTRSVRWISTRANQIVVLHAVRRRPSSSRLRTPYDHVRAARGESRASSFVDSRPCAPSTLAFSGHCGPLVPPTLPGILLVRPNRLRHARGRFSSLRGHPGNRLRGCRYREQADAGDIFDELP